MKASIGPTSLSTNPPLQGSTFATPPSSSASQAPPAIFPTTSGTLPSTMTAQAQSTGTNVAAPTPTRQALDNKAQPPQQQHVPFARGAVMEGAGPKAQAPGVKPLHTIPVNSTTNSNATKSAAKVATTGHQAANSAFNSTSPALIPFPVQQMTPQHPSMLMATHALSQPQIATPSPSPSTSNSTNILQQQQQQQQQILAAQQMMMNRMGYPSLVGGGMQVGSPGVPSQQHMGMQFPRQQLQFPTNQMPQGIQVQQQYPSVQSQGFPAPSMYMNQGFPTSFMQSPSVMYNAQKGAVTANNMSSVAPTFLAAAVTPQAVAQANQIQQQSSQQQQQQQQQNNIITPQMMAINPSPIPMTQAMPMSALPISSNPTSHTGRLAMVASQPSSTPMVPLNPTSTTAVPKTSAVKKQQAPNSSREFVHVCSYCKKGFSRQVHLQSHIRIHTGEKPYNCDQCHKSFKQKVHLRTHLLTHTGVKDFKCSECNKEFTLQSQLTTHFRIHSGEKPFKCNVCQRAFTQKIHLVRHLKTHNK